MLNEIKFDLVTVCVALSYTYLLAPGPGPVSHPKQTTRGAGDGADHREQGGEQSLQDDDCRDVRE